jgi:hypothetical protein
MLSKEKKDFKRGKDGTHTSCDSLGGGGGGGWKKTRKN